ncbi:MAG: TolC family protein [Bacteroidaceae bacterium]|nr:TolC family protein [Bacteroidaceae bacterium]
MRKIDYRHIMAVLLLCMPMVLQAQVYSLDSCVSMALKSNKEMKAAQHKVSQYQYTSKSLYANFFPNISGLANEAYGTFSVSKTVDIATPLGQYMSGLLQNILPDGGAAMSQQMMGSADALNPRISMKMKNFFMAGVMLEQPIYMGGKIKTGYQMGKLGVQMAQLGKQLSREEVVVSVYEGYQQLVKAKEMRVVALKYDSLLIQLTKEVNGAVRHGLASRNDELKVLVKKNDAELKIRQAENGIRLAKMNLCQLMGLPLHTDVDVEEDVDTAFVALVDNDAQVDGRVEAQILQLKTQLAEQKVKLERSNYLPQLGLMVHAGMLDGMELMGNKMFKDKLNFVAGVVLKVPLFHAWEGRNKVAAAKEELEQERLMQADLLDKMNLELQQKANLVDEAVLELMLRKRNLEQCQENLRVSQGNYSVGFETLSDLLTAQMLWQQAYSELVESEYQVKTKMMQWRKAAGRIDL